MIYAAGKIIFYIYFRLFYRVRVSGQSNIPDTGGLIICSNHIHFLDPLLIGSFTKRRLHFIGKKEIFANPLFTFVLERLGVIPVDRENPGMSVYKQAIAVLKADGAIGIFAQGTRVSDNEANDAKAGVALFALKGEACVVPANITSRYKLFSKIYLTFGEPIFMNEYSGKKVKADVLSQITEKIMNRVAELRVASE